MTIYKHVLPSTRAETTSTESLSLPEQMKQTAQENLVEASRDTGDETYEYFSDKEEAESYRRRSYKSPPKVV